MVWFGMVVPAVKHLKNTFDKFFKQSSNLDHNSTNKNALQIGLFIAMSRVIAAVRDAVISRFIELEVYDMYTLAQKIPSMIRRLSSEGCLENAYVPSLAKFSKRTESLEASKWISGISGVIAVFSMFVVYLTLVTSPFWVKFLLRRAKSANIVVFTDIFVIALPIILLYFASSTAIAISHRYEQFTHANIGQPIANTGMALTLILGYSITDSHFILAFCIITGATVHLIWQHYGLRKISRASLTKKPIFPDKVAETIVLIMGGFWVAFVIMLIMDYLGFKVPISVFYYSLTATSILFVCFTLCVGIMNKMPGDGTLEYGSITVFPSTSSNLMTKVTNFLYICSIISVILRKISVFAPFETILNLATNVMIMGIALLNAINIKKYIESTVMYSFIFNKNKAAIIFANLTFAGLSFASIGLQQIYIGFLIADHFLQLYRLNILSNQVTDKIRAINSNFLRISADAFFGTGIHQIMSFVSIAVSAQLGPGAPSYMNRADKIIQFPIGILGVAFGTALLPRISKLISEGQQAEAQSTYNKAILLNLGLSIAIIVASLYLAESLAKIFLGGKTNYKDIEVICKLFKIQLIALPSSIIIKTLNPVYFATHQSGLIKKAAIVQCVVDVTLKVLTLIAGLGLEWMAFSWVIGSWANAIFLLINSSKDIDPFAPFNKLLRLN